MIPEIDQFSKLQKAAVDFFRRITQTYVRGGFSYRDAHLYQSTKEEEEAPFEKLLRYTTQKAINAFELAYRIADLKGPQPLELLDIGTSKGTLFSMLVGQLLEQSYRRHINFTLLEPDGSSLPTLRAYARAMRDASSGRFVSTVVQSGWEECASEKHDVIICSHVIYHFPPQRFFELFRKMTDTLNPGGKLFVIAREKGGNEVYSFIQQYKMLATGERFNEITIQDALPALEELVDADPTLEMSQKLLRAQATLPFVSATKDAQMLAAFFLQCSSWESLRREGRDFIMKHYGGKDHELAQLDRMVEIARFP